MFNSQFLQKIYQQWCDGQSDVSGRWLDFVKLAATHSNVSVEVMTEELKKYRWFNWRE